MARVTTNGICLINRLSAVILCALDMFVYITHVSLLAYFLLVMSILAIALLFLDCV